MRLEFDPWPCSVGWGSSIAVHCGVGHRCGSDPKLLWPEATAPIGPLAWEPPYSPVATPNRPKKKKKKKKREKLRGSRKRVGEDLEGNTCDFRLERGFLDEAKDITT